MGYHRVIPRDLFNESKLLKCLGQLSLLIFDGKASDQREPSQWQLDMYHKRPEEGFIITQSQSDGGLSCSNLDLFVRNHRVDGVFSSETTIPVDSAYNSKQPYPLLVTHNGINVLNENGNLSPEMIEWLNQISESVNTIRFSNDKKFVELWNHGTRVLTIDVKGHGLQGAVANAQRAARTTLGDTTPKIEKELKDALDLNFRMGVQIDRPEKTP